MQLDTSFTVCSKKPLLQKQFVLPTSIGGEMASIPHMSQRLDEFLELYETPLQRVHVVAEWLLKVPAKQMLHLVSPSTEYVPGKQSSQLMALEMF